MSTVNPADNPANVAAPAQPGPGSSEAIPAPTTVDTVPVTSGGGAGAPAQATAAPPPHTSPTTKVVTTARKSWLTLTGVATLVAMFAATAQGAIPATLGHWGIVAGAILAGVERVAQALEA